MDYGGSAKEIRGYAGSIFIGRVGGIFSLSSLYAMSECGSMELQRSFSWCFARLQVDDSCGDTSVTMLVSRTIDSPLNGLLAGPLVGQSSVGSSILRFSAKQVKYLGGSRRAFLLFLTCIGR